MHERFKKKGLHITGLVVTIAIVVVWSVLLGVYGADKISSWIGVTNGYILMFIVATIGGASTMTSTSLYATLITLAAGGLNPWLLGLFCGIGLVIGDSLIYYLGWSGGGLFTGKLRKGIDILVEWLKSKNKFYVGLFVYFYAGFSPFPNDIMTVSIGLAGYDYKLIFPGLLLGNLTLATIVAHLASSGLVV